MLAHQCVLLCLSLCILQFVTFKPDRLGCFNSDMPSSETHYMHFSGCMQHIKYLKACLAIAFAHSKYKTDYSADYHLSVDTFSQTRLVGH